MVESSQDHPRPTAKEIRASAGKTVADVIAPGLKVLFVGINPGLYTAAIGHHFGRPGNRFWPTLFAAGFTSQLLSPYEERELLKAGYGITNIVPRATATADELTKEELRQGAQVLRGKVAEYKPKTVAILGIGAYRTAFDHPKARLGLQEETLAGSKLWVLPNPSGLNAHYDLEGLADVFRVLKNAIG